MPTDLPWVAKLEVEGTYESERFVNVMHFSKTVTDPFTDAELATLLGILDDASTDTDSLAHIYSILDSGLLVDTLTLTSLSNDAPIQRSATVAIAGTSGGSNMPPMCSATVKWSTSIANRQSRGRTFFTGLNTGMMSASNADRLDTTWSASLATRASAFATAWAASTSFAFVILSAKQRQLNALVPVNEVTSASVNPLITVQRRRRERAT